MCPAEVVGVLFLFLCFIYITNRIPASTLFKGGRIFLIIAIFIGVSEYWNTRNPVLTATAVVRYMNIILLSIIFTDCTSAFDVAHVFGKSRIGIILSLALAMLPLTVSSVKKTIDAGKARGASFFRSPVSYTTLFVTSLVLNLLDKAGSFSDALTARSFEADC